MSPLGGVARAPPVVPGQPKPQPRSSHCLTPQLALFALYSNKNDSRSDSSHVMPFHTSLGWCIHLALIGSYRISPDHTNKATSSRV
ncbi:hypothetical protein DACRYDRAFT_114534 [Dacryopinax primogenitus]|uniref:Uncharacterized protein n=1 Tax=Dacryopinax primogenitus (strain DJM 731) TaxID=1858805 RepID=M5GFH1_DACPD|nr:uncharacterized protein DACRYDRAFT_114534 [Dacryopinax primogenitus]EJU04133.1 hypothetical protein DACRYDRAFT_114534 [Dacryopinax primogenitus]